jgi:nucleotide-binding universal stress UspA family protein
MFKTILWATDGSATADRALPYAKSLAEGEGKRLIAVHCRELLIGGRASGYPLLADDDELQEKILRQVEEARAEGLDATAEVISAAAPGAAHVIADAAREIGADVIVVGTRGHAPVAGLLVGSVTQRLLHVAPCPVFAVPAGKQAEIAERELEKAAAGL